MIRVRKSKTTPPELKRAYNDDQVYRQLLADQDEKCYLCERKVSTDYRVDHLVSQNNRPDMEKDWSNIFLVCDYCNRKKWNKS